MYFCCSGLYQRVSSHCLLLWEPTDKASAQGKLSLLRWTVKLWILFIFIFDVSVHVCAFSVPWVNGLMPAMQCSFPPNRGSTWTPLLTSYIRTLRKVVFYLCFAVLLSKWVLPLLNRFPSGLLYQSIFYIVWICVLNCAVPQCRNGRLSKLWRFWTFSASKLM